eukprot:Em0008g221a
MYWKVSPMGKSQYDAYSQTLKDLESALIYLHQEADNVQQLATYAAITTGAVTPTVEELLELSGNCYKRIQVQATENTPELKSEAEAVYEIFHTIFTQFSECHVLYDSTVLTQDGIQKLDQAIKNFFSSFDRNFKSIARTLKMQDHMLQWLSMHQAGCGLMGEQGAESIHTKFNSSLRTYSAIKDPVAKMKSILQDHYLSISPHMTSALPLPKKRKLKKTST